MFQTEGEKRCRRDCFEPVNITDEKVKEAAEEALEVFISGNSTEKDVGKLIIDKVLDAERQNVTGYNYTLSFRAKEERGCTLLIFNCPPHYDCNATVFENKQTDDYKVTSVKCESKKSSLI